MQALSLDCELNSPSHPLLTLAKLMEFGFSLGYGNSEAVTTLDSLDFISTAQVVAPFLVAVTLE